MFGIGGSVSSFFGTRTKDDYESLVDARGYLEDKDGLEETTTSSWGLNPLKYSLDSGQLWVDSMEEGEFELTYKADWRTSFGTSIAGFDYGDEAEDLGLEYEGGLRNTVTMEGLETDDFDEAVDIIINYDSIIS